MIDRRILRLTPKRFFCPLCGEWHDWKGKTLQSYDEDNPYDHDCNDAATYIWVNEDQICINANLYCLIADDIEAYVDLHDIKYDGTNPVIKIPLSLKCNEFICESECKDCDRFDVCNMVHTFNYCNDRIDWEYYGGKYYIPLEYKFEFNSRYFNKYSEVDCEEMLEQQREAEETNRQEELQDKAQPNPKQQVKEDTTMANNNIFNMNMEFGPNKDENIASTLMGVAVKNGDSWRIYDKKKKEITDVGDMQLGNLPIFILPTTKLSEGDLIKDAGEYYFVMKVDADSTQTLCAKTGEMKTVIPIKNVLGFSCYSKVIALSDSLNMSDDLDVEKLAIMSTMIGQPSTDGNQMNQLLPLMLFKDKLGGSDDMMKMMLVSSMSSTESGNQMNQLLPLMLFKDKLGGDDDMMKMMLMSSAMCGNMAGNNNLAMTYLMFDTFMNKKDK